MNRKNPQQLRQPLPKHLPQTMRIRPKQLPQQLLQLLQLRPPRPRLEIQMAMTNPRLKKADHQKRKSPGHSTEAFLGNQPILSYLFAAL
jgi:hypothetical protein